MFNCHSAALIFVQVFNQLQHRHQVSCCTNWAIAFGPSRAIRTRISPALFGRCCDQIAAWIYDASMEHYVVFMEIFRFSGGIARQRRDFLRLWRSVQLHDVWCHVSPHDSGALRHVLCTGPMRCITFVHHRSCVADWRLRALYSDFFVSATNFFPFVNINVRLSKNRNNILSFEQAIPKMLRFNHIRAFWHYLALPHQQSPQQCNVTETRMHDFKMALSLFLCI